VAAVTGLTRVAAVDCGTNSTRLLVADAGEPLTEVERQMRITRLGAGVDATGRLDDAALERTLAVVDDYARRWEHLGATRVRVTATSAVRDAGDRDRFFAGVRTRTGVDAEVLTGEQEAQAAFRGATATVTGRAPYLVCDIGGGSTELVLGESDAQSMTSRQLGCVRITETYLPDERPSRAQLAAAIAVVDRHLAAAAERVPVDRARTLIGVAGTVTTVGALHLELPSYEPDAIHGARVPAVRVREIADRLASMTSAERAALGPMAPGREDVIVGGAVILARVLETYGFEDVLVSESDGLDGVALGLLDGAGSAAG
jgi:exopolyphosphatase / guanosine-5'-triphosphate,3'-diphosphate pyrophosphatase